MVYHPIIGIIIFLSAIILSFFLGSYVFRKYRKQNLLELDELKTTNQINSPPEGDITSPDAPWLKNKVDN